MHKIHPLYRRVALTEHQGYEFRPLFFPGIPMMGALKADTRQIPDWAARLEDSESDGKVLRPFCGNSKPEVDPIIMGLEPLLDIQVDLSQRLNLYKAAMIAFRDYFSVRLNKPKEKPGSFSFEHKYFDIRAAIVNFSLVLDGLSFETLERYRDYPELSKALIGELEEILRQIRQIFLQPKVARCLQTYGPRESTTNMKEGLQYNLALADIMSKLDLTEHTEGSTLALRTVLATQAQHPSEYQWRVLRGALVQVRTKSSGNTTGLDFSAPFLNHSLFQLLFSRFEERQTAVTALAKTVPHSYLEFVQGCMRHEMQLLIQSAQRRQLAKETQELQSRIKRLSSGGSIKASQHEDMRRNFDQKIREVEATWQTGLLALFPLVDELSEALVQGIPTDASATALREAIQKSWPDTNLDLDELSDPSQLSKDLKLIGRVFNELLQLPMSQMIWTIQWKLYDWEQALSYAMYFFPNLNWDPRTSTVTETLTKASEQFSKTFLCHHKNWDSITHKLATFQDLANTDPEQAYQTLRELLSELIGALVSQTEEITQALHTCNRAIWMIQNTSINAPSMTVQVSDQEVGQITLSPAQWRAVQKAYARSREKTRVMPREMRDTWVKYQAENPDAPVQVYVTGQFAIRAKDLLGRLITLFSKHTDMSTTDLGLFFSKWTALITLINATTDLGGGEK